MTPIKTKSYSQTKNNKKVIKTNTLLISYDLLTKKNYKPNIYVWLYKKRKIPIIFRKYLYSNPSILNRTSNT